MPTITITTPISAPPAVCFDLARDVGLHLESMQHSGERVVAGRTEGLLELDDEITWEGRHLGVMQRLSVRITKMDRPHRFRDEMTHGAFSLFTHDHAFEAVEGGGTLMTDRIVFRSPLGPIGWLVDRFVLKGYLRRLITARAEAMRVEAERSLAATPISDFRV